ncbi:MAG: A/G-specific adenine glycosylase [Cyanobacteria bacterium REEB65]|nr:A/G-specific adenine glycosylase [Cyanobacteria bacterium REEB65]
MPHPLSSKLLAWFDAHKRPMPWRETRDPYAILVSEVMLQQTQVATVTSYWERFMKRFPTIQALAEAPLDDLHKAWEGLGYYSRARNLQHAAQQIVDRHGGVVPGDLAALRALSGVGPYTAGAVASIAFGLPEPAVDGNVIRVLARFYWLTEDVTQPAIRSQIETLARSMQCSHRPGDFNQSLMELGATVCTPRSPGCDGCPLVQECRAAAAGDPASLPVKRKKAAPPFADLAVAVCLQGDRVLLARRPPKGLLAGMLGFPAERRHPAEPLRTTLERALAPTGIHAEVGEEWLTYPFVFSSLRTTHRAYLLHATSGEPIGSAYWADRTDLERIALPASLAPVRNALLQCRDWQAL